MMTLVSAAALALQSAPVIAAPVPDAVPPASAPAPADALRIDDLPVDQAAAVRCAIAFATVSRWQKAGEPRGAAYPDMETGGGREFFVRTMAQVMDSTGLTRDGVVQLIFGEVEASDNPAGEERLKAMMPACQMLKSTAGL